MFTFMCCHKQMRELSWVSKYVPQGLCAPGALYAPRAMWPKGICPRQDYVLQGLHDPVFVYLDEKGLKYTHSLGRQEAPSSHSGPEPAIQEPFFPNYW